MGGGPALTPTLPHSHNAEVRLVFATALVGYLVATSVLFWYEGGFDLRYYTFWAYLAQTALSPLLVVAAVWPLARRAVLRWLWPLWYGTVWLVFLGSRLMIAENGGIFLHNTTVAVPPGPVTVGVAFLADNLVHVVPLLAVLLYATLEWEALRQMHAGELSATASRGHWAAPVGHLLYFFLVPTVPFAVYALVQDVGVRYPTYFDTPLAVATLLALVVLIQGTVHQTLMRRGLAPPRALVVQRHIA